MFYYDTALGRVTMICCTLAPANPKEPNTKSSVFDDKICIFCLRPSQMVSQIILTFDTYIKLTVARDYCELNNMNNVDKMYELINSLRTPDRVSGVRLV